MNQKENLKVVIIVAYYLDKGPAANRTAVLATGLAAHVPGMIGSNLKTKDNISLLSFTQIPIPILTSKPEMPLLNLAHKARDLSLGVIVFLARAQGMRSYQEYIESVAQTDYKDLDVDAVAIWGDRKLVTRLTGNLPSLR